MKTKKNGFRVWVTIIPIIPYQVGFKLKTHTYKPLKIGFEQMKLEPSLTIVRFGSF